MRMNKGLLGGLLGAVMVSTMAAAPAPVTLSTADFAAWVASLKAVNTAATAPITSAPSVTPGGSPQLMSAPWFRDQGILSTYDVGKSGGVVGLDSAGDILGPLKSPVSWLGDWTKYATAVDRYSRGYEASLFGGVTPVGTNYVPQSVFLQTDPYGPYAPGCGLGVAMTGSVYSSQFPVSEADPAAGASSVVAAGLDTVANCTLVANRPARLVLSATGYTPTTVKLVSALTAAQAAQIKPNMYIVTNSPNPSLTPAAVAGQLPPRNLYSGFVNAQPSAGDTSIGVYAWDVSGIGTGASGQVPQTNTLDTTWSAYTSPTVFLGGGSAEAAFAHNWFFNVDVNDLKPSASNRSLIRQLTPLEVDLNFVNGTAPANSIWWQGISMNAGNQPDALTKDSRQFFMGGNINHHLIINGGCGNWDYESTSGGGQTLIPTPCGIAIGGSVTTQVMQGWEQWIHGTNRLDMMLSVAAGNSAAPVGWQEAVVHLGPTIDGTPVQSGDWGGSKQGDIQWNQGGNYGSVSLCGYGTKCGIMVDGSGVARIQSTGVVAGTNGLTIGAQPSGYVAGLGVYMPTGDTNNPVDVEVGGVSRFLVSPDGDGTFSRSVSATNYHESLSTPASSSAPCSAGDFTDDADYHYVCTATNTWKRVALSTF